MKSYTIDEMRRFSQKIFAGSEIILLHSALQNLGKLEGERFQDIPKIWLETLSADSKHLIMPCFNYSFPKSNFADLRTLKSEVGILSETFRSWGVENYAASGTESGDLGGVASGITNGINSGVKSGVASGINSSAAGGIVRSTHPMFGFCGSGVEIKKLLKPDEVESNPFCEKSVYGRLWEQNALMVFLGIDIRVCTFMVFVEAMFGVKYRYFKPFFGRVVGDFGEVFGDFYHFCLPLGESLRVNFFRVQEEMIARGIIQVAEFGGGKAYSFYAKPFLEYVTKRLQESPFILLQEAPKHFYAFKEGREVQV